jgi:hypothetical protein
MNMTLNNFRRFFKELFDASEMYIQDRYCDIKETDKYTVLVIKLDSYVSCQLFTSKDKDKKEKQWINGAIHEIKSDEVVRNLYFFYDKLSNHLKPITAHKALNILENLVY